METKPQKKVNLLNTFRGIQDEEMNSPDNAYSGPKTLGTEMGEIGSALYKGGEKAVQDFGSGVKQIGSAIGEGIQSGASAVGRGLDKVGSAIGEGVRSAASWVDKNPDFLIGATPVLMGFLTGDYEDGYGIASKTLLGEADRRQKLADEAYKLQLKKEAESKQTKEKAQSISLVNKETGETIAAQYLPESQSYVDASGNPLEMNKYAFRLPLDKELNIKNKAAIRKNMQLGKHIELKNDPVTKELLGYNKMTQSTFKIPTKNELAADQINYIKDTRKRLEKTDKTLQFYNSAKKGLLMAESGSILERKAALKELATSIEKGKLSDFDVTYLISPFGGMDAALDWAKRVGAGKVDRLDKELKQALIRSMNEEKARIRGEYEREYNLGDIARLNKDQMKQYVGEPVGIKDFAIVELNGKRFPVHTDDLGRVLKLKENKKAKVVGYE